MKKGSARARERRGNEPQSEKYIGLWAVKTSSKDRPKRRKRNAE